MLQYVLQPILSSTIWTITPMRLNSHLLQCETRQWSTCVETNWLCTFYCLKQVHEYNYHILMQCSSFDHVQLGFPCIFDSTQSFHKFLSWSQCAFSIVTFINKVCENVIFFCLIAHIQPPMSIRENSILLLHHTFIWALMCEHVFFMYFINRKFMPDYSIIKWPWFDFSTKILCFLIQHLWEVNHRSLVWPIGCEILLSKVCSY